MSQIFFKKNEGLQLGNHFSSNEFQCQCNYLDCVDQMVEQDLIDKLDSLREQVGQPIKINSGFRCARHQADLLHSGAVETVPKSTHELGQAADIACPIPIDDLYKAAEKQFMAIGTAHHWLHCDLRTGKVRRWTYNY